MLPKIFLPLILAFRPLFSQPVWSSASVLLVGAILAPGKRTVSAILRVMGLSEAQQFQRYHRSGLKSSHLVKSMRQSDSLTSVG